MSDSVLYFRLFLKLPDPCFNSSGKDQNFEIIFLSSLLLSKLTILATILVDIMWETHFDWSRINDNFQRLLESINASTLFVVYFLSLKSHRNISRFFPLSALNFRHVVIYFCHTSYHFHLKKEYLPLVGLCSKAESFSPRQTRTVGGFQIALHKSVMFRYRPLARPAIYSHCRVGNDATSMSNKNKKMHCR